MQPVGKPCHKPWPPCARLADLHAGLPAVHGPAVETLCPDPWLPPPRRSLDYLLGYLLFGGLFLLSFLGFVSRIQAALLFNVKFAKSLKRGRLLVRVFSLRPLARADC